jgi:hypothetical protein
VLLGATAPGATTPAFAADTELPTGSAVYVSIRDLNGDGRPDLAVANAFTATVSILFGQ